MKFGVIRCGDQCRCGDQVHKGRNTSNTIPGSKGNDARIANPAMAPELCAIKCRQLNEFKYVKLLRSRSNFRLEQIAAIVLAHPWQSQLRSPADFSLRSYPDQTSKSGGSVMPPVPNMKSRTRRFLPRFVYGFAGENDLPNKWYQPVPHFFRVFGVSG